MFRRTRRIPKTDRQPNTALSRKKHAAQSPTWMVVANTNGVAQAEIIAGRLKSVGIPAIIHREAVGAALGLTIGLGQAVVAVPEAYYEPALAVLTPDPSVLWVGDGEPDQTEQHPTDESHEDNQ